MIPIGKEYIKVSKGAKIRNRYNQVPHLTQDTNGKVTNSQIDTTNESQEVSPFPAGDHKAHINGRAQRHSKHKTEQKHKRSTKNVLKYMNDKTKYQRFTRLYIPNIEAISYHACAFIKQRNGPNRPKQLRIRRS